MVRCLALLMLAGISGVAFSQAAAAPIASGQVAAPQPDPASETPPGDLTALPPVPPGKSTIMGGEIRYVNQVRDELTLKVFGQRPVKILFDERTQVYRDGKKIPLLDLRTTDHASVQTVLDGTNVFALSIHILSQTPEGDYEGRVLNYNPSTTELTISSALSSRPMKLLVAADAKVVREGQPSFIAGQRGLSDLVRGDLVSVKFAAGKSGRGVASEISILATPGAEFVFIGNITALDTHTGTLVLVDPRDDKSYQISFSSSRLPTSKNLHVGDHIIVNADFDGIRYEARAITAN